MINQALKGELTGVTWKTNIVCNGFSMKDVIIEVLKKQTSLDFYGCEDEIAEEIKDAFISKLGFIQS